MTMDPEDGTIPDVARFVVTLMFLCLFQKQYRDSLGHMVAFKPLRSTVQDYTSEFDLDRATEELFWSTDVDGSGSLCVQELTTLLHKHGHSMSTRKLQEHFDTFDHDGDGRISYDEYLRGMGRSPEVYLRYALYRTMFRALDNDCDWSLAPCEFAHALRRLALTETEIRSLFDSMGSSGSDRISYRDFIRYIHA